MTKGESQIALMAAHQLSRKPDLARANAAEINNSYVAELKAEFLDALSSSSAIDSAPVHDSVCRIHSSPTQERVMVAANVLNGVRSNSDDDEKDDPFEEDAESICDDEGDNENFCFPPQPSGYIHRAWKPNEIPYVLDEIDGSCKWPCALQHISDSEFTTQKALWEEHCRAIKDTYETLVA